MTDEEKMALLKRMVEDTSLVSDGTLRAEVALLFGWNVKPYPRGQAPWEKAAREREHINWIACE